MTFIKLKNEILTKSAYFSPLPDWTTLATRITESFDILLESVTVTYIDQENDQLSLTNERDLQDYYRRFDKPPQELKFIVLDVQDLRAGARAAIAAAWSPGSSLHDTSNPGLPTSRKRTAEQTEPDIFDYYKITEKWGSKRLQQHLPSLEELAASITSPLDPSEKIPIPQEWFDSLVSPLYPDECTHDDVASVFQVSPRAEPNFIFFFTVANGPPPPGTEYSFVYFWDTNIRSILERLLPEAKVLRNSSQHTLTNMDHALILRNLCLWRGEEEPDESANPKQDLLDKLVWVYDAAP